MPLLTEQLELQQRDYLCGPFHAARVLRDHGVVVDQDAVAQRAGTTLPHDATGEVPPGALSDLNYRYALPRADAADAGTSPRGLAAAIEELSERRLVCVPISGQWGAEAVEGLFKLQARLIANLRTGLLWGSRPPADALLSVLAGDPVADPPPAEWDVGHFVELVELLRGRAGDLVVVRDSYPTLGYGGVYFQPSQALAAALNRDDGRQGGVLAVSDAGGQEAISRLAPELGLQAEMWDN
jgi:hypothetical protein